VTTTEITEALSRLEIVEPWPAGRVLFREGEAPRGIYAVHTGRVDVIYSSSNGVTRPLRVAERGRILGLSANVSRRPHDYSATTRTACEIGFVPREELLQMLIEEPAVWLQVLQMLSEDVNGCYDCMRAIAVR
jgi:CRP/FNR family transcriptional regulator